MARSDYRFLDKDPHIDIVRTGLLKSGLSIPQLAERCKQTPRAQTLYNWLIGDTKYPQRYKMGRVLAALGIDTEYRWSDTGEIVKPSAAAKNIWKKKARARARKKNRN